MKKRLLSCFMCIVLTASLSITDGPIRADELVAGDFIPVENLISDDVVIDDGSESIIIGDGLAGESEAGTQDGVLGQESDSAEYTFGEIEENASSSIIVIDEGSINVELLDESVLDEAKQFDNRQLIVDFGQFDTKAYEKVIYEDDRPTFAELTEDFPDKINVVIAGRNSMTEKEIDVTWYCVGEDYEKSEGFYFQFSPKWDDSQYKLADGLSISKDAPYIPVTVDFVDDIELDEEVVYEDGVSYKSTYRSTAASEANKEYVYQYLTGCMGLSSAAACGIMANIQYESSFRSDIYGDNGTSYGLCQWHNSRFTNLRNYCSSNGYDYTTVEGQMHFLQYELSNSYNSIYNYMKNVNNSADGAYDAGYYWCVKFEVPANKEQKGVIRGNLARDTYWPTYGSGNDNPNPTPTPTPAVGKTYSITYVTYGGVNSPFNPVSYVAGRDSFRLYDASLSGYVFDGWYLDYSYSTKITEINQYTRGDLVLWAKWKPVTYKVKFNGNGSDSGSMSILKGRSYGSSFKLTANKFSREGYTFKGWNTKKNGSGKSYKNKATVNNLTTKNGATVTLYAQWTKKAETKYTIKFNGNGATSGSMSRMTNCKYSKEYTLNANNYEREGYVFAGWNTMSDGSGDSYEDQAVVSKLSSKNGGIVVLYAMWEQE